MAERRDRRARKLLERRSRSVRALPQLTEVLRGSLRERYIRCGKPGCHCQEGLGHGPITYLSVSLGVGTNQQITIAPEDRAVADRLVRNYRRVQDALEGVATINRELLQLRLLPRPEQTASRKPPPARRKGPRPRKRP